MGLTGTSFIPMSCAEKPPVRYRPNQVNSWRASNDSSGATQTNHSELCVGCLSFSGCVDPSDVISDDTSRMKLDPLASRRPRACMKSFIALAAFRASSSLCLFR